MTERLDFHFSLSCIGEGNGNPLQYSCLENPRDGGAWWAAIYGVAQSRTRLKQLSSSSSSNQLLMGFPGGSEGKAAACNEGDLGSIPESGRSSGEGNGKSTIDSRKNHLQLKPLDQAFSTSALQTFFIIRILTVFF